jgi:hypothetical protein
MGVPFSGHGKSKGNQKGLESSSTALDFKTESAAKLAGEKALVAFLDGLAKEERNA